MATVSRLPRLSLVALAPIVLSIAFCASSSSSPPPSSWVSPAGHAATHNGGQRERLVAPASASKPHIVMVLADDLGWAEVGWHRNYSIGGVRVAATREVQTPRLDQLVREGMELDRAYVYKCCSPTRSAVQSGRNPYHVNPLNAAMEIHNLNDTVSGYAGIPRNMTGMATKLAAAGYRNYMFGKWDAGMAVADQTPHGRGYHEGLCYFHHDNDYWDQNYQLRCPLDPSDPESATVTLTDLWRKAPGSAAGGSAGKPARGFNSSCAGMNGKGGRPAACTQGPLAQDEWWAGYEDSLFEQQILQAVEKHDASVPMLLFWAPHIAHAPLQVPDSVAAGFAFIGRSASGDNADSARQRMHAMVHFLDGAVGNVTDALKRKPGMWESTIMVFFSDNGGWMSANGTAGGNNFPLTGGKYNNFEGGIRSNSFVTGGVLGAQLRGTKFDGLVTGWDMYATFCAFAGVDSTDHRAALAGLPPIDSVDMSAVFLGARATSPRKEIPVGNGPRATNLTTGKSCTSYRHAQEYDWRVNGNDPIASNNSSGGTSGESSTADPQQNCTTVATLIVDEESHLWKLITGDEKQYVGTGAEYPNASTNFESQDPRYVRHCGDGCLFDLRADPLERDDVAAAYPLTVRALTAKLAAYEASAFNPDRGKDDGTACKVGLGLYGGFWGPFLELS